MSLFKYYLVIILVNTILNFYYIIMKTTKILLIVLMSLFVSWTYAVNLSDSEDDAIMCTMQYDPVCWVDWKTYWNSCVATAQNKVQIAYKWECRENIEKNIYWEITLIENWKDGKQIYVTTADWTVYTTAVWVIGDEFVNWKYWDLVLATRVKVYYTDEVSEMNLLIWNKIEIISKWLWKNDEWLYSKIRETLDEKYQESVDSVIIKYNKLLEKYSNEKKQEITNIMVNKLELKISKFLSNFPQDLALSQTNNNKYMTLSLLKFELMKLDFYK